MIGEIGPESFKGGAGGECTARAGHHLDAVALKDGDEKIRELGGGLHPEILLVEPLGLFKVEAGAGFDDAVKGEDGDQFIYAIKFPLSAGVPAQEGQKVYEGLREVAVLTVAAGDFSGFRVGPLEREYRETKAVSVPLAQFSLAVRLQKKAQMGKVGHGVRPAKGLVKEVVQGQ